MKDVDFAITINMTLSMGKDMATVTVKNVDLKPAMITLPMLVSGDQAGAVEKQKTYHEIILEVAREVVNETGNKIFSAADLYHKAKKKYPHVKRATFNNRVMAAAPEHGSWGSLSGKKDFLKFRGQGKYELKGG